MDLHEVVHLREKMAKDRELRKSVVKEIMIDSEDLGKDLEKLTEGFNCTRKICVDFFPKDETIRKISKVVIFNFGQISSWDATEKMASLGFLPANVYEALVGINKLQGELPGTFFISGSPLDPEEVTTTYPTIKINGGRLITLNVDMKTDIRFFVGVGIIEEQTKKAV